MEEKQPEKDKYSTIKGLLDKPLIKTDNKFVQYSGLGVQLAAVILVFLFAGMWIDKYFETKFIFTLIFTFLGFFGGFYSFYLTIQKLSASDKKNTFNK